MHWHSPHPPLRPGSVADCSPSRRPAVALAVAVADGVAAGAAAAAVGRPDASGASGVAAAVVAFAGYGRRCSCGVCPSSGGPACASHNPCRHHRSEWIGRWILFFGGIVWKWECEMIGVSSALTSSSCGVHTGSVSESVNSSCSLTVPPSPTPALELRSMACMLLCLALREHCSRRGGTLNGSVESTKFGLVSLATLKWGQETGI